jgi:arylsulfatase A-like enzyme
MQRQQKTLAHFFSTRGYPTAAYVNFGLLRQGNMTGKGFERRAAILDTPRALSLEKKKNNVYAYAMRWARKKWKDPFFQWVHSQFLHMEDIPEPYNTMFWENPTNAANSEVQGQRFFPLLTEDGRRQTRVRYNLGSIELTDEEMAAATAFYDGCLRFTDEYIKLCLESLADYGLDPFTAIIVTSDHGVSLGERHAIRHMGPPYDHLLKVPLICVMPGSGQVPGGRVEGLVELVDLAPTIMSYAGMPIPRRMQGMDLMPLMRDPSLATKEHVYAMVPGRKTGHWYSVRSRDARYFAATGGDEFLETDFEGDPHSTLLEHPELAAELKHELMSWMKQTPDVTSQTEQDVSEEVREMLRKAGYLDASQ